MSPNIPTPEEVAKALREFEAQENSGQIPQNGTVPSVPVDPALSNIPKAESAPGGEEISAALKEFEVTGGAPIVYETVDEIPGMVKWTMGVSGLSRKQSEYVLFGIIAVMMGTSIYLFIRLLI